VPLRLLAKMTGVSASHLQREFTRALGVSPREYQAACRAARFRDNLRSGRDVTSATYEAGYGSPSRVYEAPPTGRGMRPATYRQGGAGAEVSFTTVRGPLGWVLVAATVHGVCAVKLGDDPAELEADLRRELPRARITTEPPVRADWIGDIVRRLADWGGTTDLPLDVRGTAFQWRVWRALQRIPRGETRTYGAIARAIGRPTASRAVARVCASNPVSLVVPCHRVVAANGLGGYRWGRSRKARLLDLEATSRSRRDKAK
jgi:AraC family transcriptional regulator of adaptative response/methylated-DNA-[protein]-cysteine methyltransferase